MNDNEIQESLNKQIKFFQTQTTKERIKWIQEQINNFEKRYRGKYNQLFGHMEHREIDGRNDAIDIADWKELEEELRQLQS